MTVHVRVPATSANLGPGYDALGLALTRYDDVYATLTGGGIQLEVDGEGPELAEAGEKHLIIQAMRAAFDRYGSPQPPGIRLRCVNRIPHGRGLGSSAAAIVAGILAARALTGAEEDPLGLATEIEGHPDNVAACLLGGLTIAYLPSAPNSSLRDVGAGATAGTAAPSGRQPPRRGAELAVVKAVRLDPHSGILPVVCIAPGEMAVRTEVARQALPARVPHRDAAANAGRAALLVAALTRPEAASALFDATQDWLHQDYRQPALPDTHALIVALRQEGIPAVVSGAGPSVLALLTSPDGSDSGRLLDSVGSIVRETGKAWHISPLDVARQGARVQRVGGYS